MLKTSLAPVFGINIYVHTYTLHMYEKRTTTPKLSTGHWEQQRLAKIIAGNVLAFVGEQVC